ncbi:MAG: DUF5615 family PIN-like protein [Bacteroidota bacterium]
MAKFLLDVNLPCHFPLWNNKAYIYQKDINDEWNDIKIWEYAKRRNLTIITQDSDFSNRILLMASPPKVIHIRCSNMKMETLFATLSAAWEQVVALNETHKLVNVFPNRIEGID